MPGFNRWRLLKMLAVVLCVAGVGSLLLMYLFPAPPSKLIIATGVKNQTYEAIAKRYREILARFHVDLEIRLTNGAADNIKLLNDPASGIKIGIVQGGISDADQSPDLLSLGRINYQIFWIFHSATELLDDLRQLKGKSIAVGPQGSGQRVMAEKILGISGVTSQNTTLLALSAQGAVDALNDGKVDALFLPFALDAPILHSLLKNPRVRPMSFTEAEALTRIFPFLVRLVLPRAVIDFESIIPAADMVLIASPNAVLVRRDIHPALIDLLAQTIVEAHGRPGIFQKAGEFPTQIDPEYPVAQSARDFYRNGPSFLHRHLPFWMTGYAQRAIAVLVAVIAIVPPLFHYLPLLYKWTMRRRLLYWYDQLKVLEASIDANPSDKHLIERLFEVERIEDAVSHIRFPLAFTDQLYNLRSHIDIVRRRLAPRASPLLRAAAE